MSIDWTNLLLGGLLIAVVVERWLCNQAIKTARETLETAAYWKRAYELLVQQTGRDLNDGFGIDPRKAAFFEKAKAPDGSAERVAAGQLRELNK